MEINHFTHHIVAKMGRGGGEEGLESMTGTYVVYREIMSS